MTDWHNHPQLKQAAQALASGQVVTYPTEGVWGLGCDPFNKVALGEIL